MELIRGRITKPAGAGSFVYCDLPGKKSRGYCREKEHIEHSTPD
jgi:hypothetical protein